MTENNLLTSYCFLSALTESNSDLFQGVYIPIVKRALSLYNRIGNEYGHDTDIQNLILDEYGISVPIVVLRQILKAIENQMSRKEKGKTGFSTLENGKSFKIEKFTFLDLEESYKIGERNAKGLQEAFEKYLLLEEISIENVPTFGQFISKNKTKLSSFFKGELTINGDNFDKTYLHHIDFLEHIEQTNNYFFQIAESVYFGSIVASLFESEIDLNAKFLNDVVYYLDTQIVLKALDLQAEAETKPIIELLNLIKTSGGKLKVLDITCGEISFIINNSIKNFNNLHPTSSVNEACLRRNLNKTWLITFNGNIESKLIELLDLEIVNIPTLLKEKFQRTEDIKELKESRKKTANAEHDVYAYLYVREKRGGSLKTFQKAKFWFLTANKTLFNFNIRKSEIGNVSEVALPDTLTALLWLQNPTKNLSKIKSIGLHELIANTIKDEIATKELINEFDASLKSVNTISEEDYKILISSVAYQSANYIDKVNSLILEREIEQFNVEAHKIIEKERKRRASVTETIRTKVLETKEKIEENEELKTTLKSLENQIKESESNTKTQLEILSEKLESQSKYFKRFLIWLVVFLLSVLVFYLNYEVFNFIEKVKDVIKIVMGLSGLWSFGSFIINLLKALKWIN
jgi:hypothetical protein